MKKFRKEFLLFLLAVFAIDVALLTTSCSSNSNSEVNNSTTNNSTNNVVDTNINSIKSQDLPLVLTDTKISQETKLSQMKAELIKENQGYLSDDLITLIVSLESDSLIDTYLENDGGFKSVSDYAVSEEGLAQKNRIENQQASLINMLYKKGLVESVNHQYSTITNAISVTCKYKNMSAISNLAAVSMVNISETYNKPQEETGNSGSAVTNVVDVYENTGIFNSGASSYTGRGTAVAILDSGYDCSHSVFQNLPEEPAFDQAYLQERLANTNAYKSTAGLLVDDVYYSSKIPFKYDYADKDFDVNPFDSNHGTHVAGIIGGKNESDNFTGVAINTQLVLLKVFPDVGDGADAEDILAGLEDAVALGVDAINMSLGASCGFAREVDESHINEVYDAIKETGISVVVAASNSYSSAYSGPQGNTNLVTNPDSSTVGSPSTYPTALSVASISGTKSRYIKTSYGQLFFFTESNNNAGKQNNFVEELYKSQGLDINSTEDVEFDYIVIPGTGQAMNYTALGNRVKGKIAVISRGDNTFEEKAQIAKSYGAIGCIIYNNVAGEIVMSMGKSDHIPTISLSKEDGTKLAKNSSGKLIFNSTYQAGPFMSNFSSWGPSADLSIKPEITAHGGNILSSVPGGGYDTLSGTSMACPNMCGVVILIRQYVKDKYPELSTVEVNAMVYQLLMSTATIAKNQDGNPYSVRKQGAGLASLADATNTTGYITVDGSDKTKLELGDDKNKTGVYKMEFNVVNVGNTALSYNVDVVGMTESVDSSDKNFVAEKPYMLNGTTKVLSVTNGTNNGNEIIVEAGQTCKVVVEYTIPDTDKKYIDDSFANGMYVEGYVTLTPTNNSTTIDLNIPFLSFYGDWTKAPMFDKTVFEVEQDEVDNTIDEDDKIKADYYATTPYGSYYASYIIPLGSYLYDVGDQDEIPATIDHIAVSDAMGTISGISQVYAGLLRNAKKMTFTITDVTSGEVIYEFIDWNAHKSYSNGASPIPYYKQLEASAVQLGLVNNKQYLFKMEGLLDYDLELDDEGNIISGDGGLNTNDRNSFEFTFYMDNEAPILTNATYSQEYDKQTKKDRHYITLDVYDNHYVQSISPIVFTRSPGDDEGASYAVLTKNPIAVYGNRNSTTTVKFEITDYLKELYSDQFMTGAIGFAIDDYALNTNVYYVTLPGTYSTGTSKDFSFTEDGNYIEGGDGHVVSMSVGSAYDLTKHMDSPIHGNKEFFKYLTWSSSNEEVATVNKGIVVAKKSGNVKITAEYTIATAEGTQTFGYIDIPVYITGSKLLSEETTTLLAEVNGSVVGPDKATLKELRFDYFKTLYAHIAAGKQSEIGTTGEVLYLSNVGSVNMYPGESIELHYTMDPWYIDPSRYTLEYSSTDPAVATVDQNGVVNTLKKGSTTIQLKMTLDGKVQVIMAQANINVKSEFIIENRQLVAYKGIGGDVVIPADEGIASIASYAFCLYDIDKELVLPEDNYDANKMPLGNSRITSVTIPATVETVDKYAFYNCPNLKTVTFLKDNEGNSKIKFIKERAFYNCTSLDTINLESVEVIGLETFYNCSSLNNINLSKIFAIGQRAFQNNTSLTTVDLSTLRNCGVAAFKNCINLESVTLTKDSKLSENMFENSGLQSVTLEMDRVPNSCFKNSSSLKTVEIVNPMVYVGKNAFENCSINSLTINNNIKYIYEYAFNNNDLTSLQLPLGNIEIHSNAFSNNEITTLTISGNTLITKLQASAFDNSNISTINTSTSDNYVFDGGILYNKDKTEIVLAQTTTNLGDFTIPASVNKIKSGAFTGNKTLTSLTITNKDLVIEDYAFANCTSLTAITLPSVAGLEIGEYAFSGLTALTEINNLDKVSVIKAYAFKDTKLSNITLNANTYGEGAFSNSTVESVVINGNATIANKMFKDCSNLTSVTFNSNVEISDEAFYNNTNLSTINLDKAVNTIGKNAFFLCISLTSINLSNVEKIDDLAFIGTNKLENVTFSSNLSYIGEGAFASYELSIENGNYVKYYPKFTSLDLSNSNISYIGKNAFYALSNLKTVVINGTIDTINESLFEECSNLEAITLPNSVVTIKDSAFYNCNKLTQANLSNIVTIENNAFSYANLGSVDLSKVVTVGDSAFDSNVNLTLSNDLLNLEYVGVFGFKDTAIEALIAPKLKELNTAAFYNCQKLTKVILSKTITRIADTAFQECIMIEDFLYQASNNELSNNGKVNDYILLSDGIIYTYLNNGYLQLHRVPQGKFLPKLVVLDNTYRIDRYAGAGNETIRDIILPDTLKYIGNHAFYGVSYLKSVEFRSFIAPELENYRLAASNPLPETAVGYPLFSKYINAMVININYYQFVNQCGLKAPIKMILPKNEGIVGYDSIYYEAYFGKVADSERSDYECKDTATLEFLAAYQLLPSVDSITLEDDAVVMNASNTYALVKQDLTNLGYTQEEADNIKTHVNEALKKLNSLKREVGSAKVRSTQAKIDALDTTFSLSKMDEYKELYKMIYSLPTAERKILDLEKYNELQKSYNEYVSNLSVDSEGVTKVIDNGYNYSVLIAVTTLTALVTIAGLAITKKYM